MQARAARTSGCFVWTARSTTSGRCFAASLDLPRGGAHSPGVVSELRADWPDKAIEHIALGEGRADMDTARARAAFRTAHAIPADATVFGVSAASPRKSAY